MKFELFHSRRKDAAVEGTRIEAGEIAIDLVRASEPLTVAVAGRMTVDSSPQLRSILLDLLRRGATPIVLVDLSALSSLDVSGIATLLEALKAASERSIKLHLSGLSGQVRALAEIIHLDAIFRSAGSEVDFR